MNRLNFGSLTCLLLCLLFSGCSTPKPILQLASKGAGTVGLAEASLRDYLVSTESQLTARQELIRVDVENLVSESQDRDLTNAFRQAAGMPVQNEGAELIRSMATKRKDAREKREKEFAKAAAENVFDASTLAKVPKEKLDSAKKSFAALSEELSSSEWLSLVGGYVKVISEGVEHLGSPTDKPENSEDKQP
jgi:hypothetical protein